MLAGGSVWREDGRCGHLVLLSFVRSKQDCLGVRHGICLFATVFLCWYVTVCSLCAPWGGTELAGRGASRQSAAGRRAASWCNGWPGWPVSGALPPARPPSVPPNSDHSGSGPLPATGHRASEKGCLSVAHPPNHSGSPPCPSYLQEVEDHPSKQGVEHLPATLTPRCCSRGRTQKQVVAPQPDTCSPLSPPTQSLPRVHIMNTQ